MVRQCCVCKRVFRNGEWVYDPSHDAVKTPTTHVYCQGCARDKREELDRIIELEREWEEGEQR